MVDVPAMTTDLFPTLLEMAGLPLTPEDHVDGISLGSVVAGEDAETWHQKMFDEIARIEAGMKAAHPDAGIDVTPSFGIPGLKPETDGTAETLVRRITGDNGTHVVSYGTEAGQFQERGFSSVICGPGDIAQAHQADEFITLAQFEAGQHFVSRLVDSLCD